MLQHKVDTEKELFYDGLFHVCAGVRNPLAGDQWDWPETFIPSIHCL